MQTEFTAGEAAEYLGMTATQLYNARSLGKLRGGRKIGRFLTFTKDELDAYKASFGDKMSLEEETIELSLAFHATRERNEELEALILDASMLLSDILSMSVSEVMARREAWMERVQELLERKP